MNQTLIFDEFRTARMNEYLARELLARLRWTRLWYLIPISIAGSAAVLTSPILALEGFQDISMGFHVAFGDCSP